MRNSHPSLTGVAGRARAAGLMIAAAALIAALALAGAAPAQVQAASGSGPPAPTHCPRACMIGVMDQYLDALV
ncbi:MAG: hypothetical protein ACRDKL_12435, partial [Solirubrobacteraceae bacterium]